jgi:ElaA protein
MHFLIKSFNELSAKETYQLLKLRSEVFVVEQNCVYLDPDGKDLIAYHILIYEQDELLGYARILPPSSLNHPSSIGRVVVDKKHRGSKFGQELMNYCIQHSIHLFKSKEIVISAQAYLIRFYSNLGFIVQGDGYLEDNIPHIKMHYKVNC